MRKRAKQGASLLLETIIGLGIFATVILILFAVFGAVGRSNSQAREHTMARALAREALDRECSKSYSTVLSVPPVLVNQPFISNGVSSSTNFQVSVVVTELIPDERKSVLVTVSWTFGNIPRRTTLESFVVKV